ncbi:T9SS type A sorting domain-containing protein [Taibaiella soli]|uniref:Secretion system C-terminal sorting domain-containing protein n=1 Tax=Taibaiella soli TaxID=1649169 RepID=A0A2W2C1A1_9BACT|nr:T9SS type A sorting domain-containing protein [Taibaiella soli]PZF73803.1 hypothetical protein DN068_05530 [Taibaiella soli]
MKKTFFFALLLIAALGAKAEIYKGGQIGYEWVTDSLYNIYVQTYLPCIGPSQPVPDSIYVCYFNSCNTTSGSIVLHRSQDSVKTAPMVRAYVYSGEFVVPSTCSHWTFYTSIAGRDSVVNINSTGSNIYLETTLNSTVNHISTISTLSGPSYNPFLLTNVPWILPGASAPDSIIYETIMPRTAPANYLNPGLCQGSYAATDLSFTDTMYNLTDNPISSNHTYTLAHVAGTRNFTAAASGLGKNILAVKATRYKNGIIVGTSMIDQEFIIAPDTGYHRVYNYLDTNSIVGGYFDANGIHAYPDSTVQFCIIATCQNTPVSIADNHGITLPGSSVSYTTANDTSRACFTWTPSLTDTGARIFTATTHYTTDTTLCENAQLIIADGQLNVPLNVINPTSVNTLSNNNAIKVFPNPAQHTVYVQTAVAVQLTVTGLDGRTLLQRKNATSVDISSLPDGIYLLRIADGSGQFLKMEKLIKTASK